MQGHICISEDSSEIRFLLVENYQLTASVGLRIGRESLEPFLTDIVMLFINDFSFEKKLEVGEDRAY